MRVLMTADSVGGVWTYALELVDALAAQEVEVTLAVMGSALRPDQRSQIRRSRASRVYAAEYALEWMDEPWRDVDRAGDWLLRIADETRPDLVHLNGYVHGALAWGRPLLVVAHSDVLSWYEAVRRRPAGQRWNRYREGVAAGLDAASIVVAPTVWMLDALLRHYAPRCPSVVIANGIARSSPASRKRELVVSAGRAWDEAKNVQAVAELAGSLPWEVVVAGPGTSGARRRALGILGRADLDRLLGAASIFAAPARYEPFGLTALEAARARCALVLGELESLREVWGEAALYVDPDDPVELERTLRALIADPKLRADYARRAHGRSLTYSADRMAADYADAYRRLLAGARREAA